MPDEERISFYQAVLSRNFESLLEDSLKLVDAEDPLTVSVAVQIISDLVQSSSEQTGHVGAVPYWGEGDFNSHSFPDCLLGEQHAGVVRKFIGKNPDSVTSLVLECLLIENGHASPDGVKRILGAVQEKDPSGLIGWRVISKTVNHLSAKDQVAMVQALMNLFEDQEKMLRILDYADVGIGFDLDGLRKYLLRVVWHFRGGNSETQDWLGSIAEDPGQTEVIRREVERLLLEKKVPQKKE
ncbi:MAG: hypothetical protein VX768_10810 [Planctomycetota bacterium]|nr:hypothetical protein [Planctomycetota bacterium]